MGELTYYSVNEDGKTACKISLINTMGEKEDLFVKMLSSLSFNVWRVNEEEVTGESDVDTLSLYNLYTYVKAHGEQVVGMAVEEAVQALFQHKDGQGNSCQAQSIQGATGANMSVTAVGESNGEEFQQDDVDSEDDILITI